MSYTTIPDYAATRIHIYKCGANQWVIEGTDDFGNPSETGWLCPSWKSAMKDIKDIIYIHFPQLK